ncbi:hypothetical protein CCH79_00008090 [Gambusia affinis]|uniref:Claudin n=1 Tax=Gambusia affinis TaxID=33528 RepID=A0A315V2S5_GAMAF|nr:hypothetical protein CCH79_00008090 [Gambusia affinis]
MATKKLGACGLGQIWAFCGPRATPGPPDDPDWPVWQTWAFCSPDHIPLVDSGTKPQTAYRSAYRSMSVMASKAVQMVCLTLGVIGLIGVITCCSLPRWRRITFKGANAVTAQVIYEGLWMNCVSQSTGQMQCRAYDSILALPFQFQAVRAMTKADRDDHQQAGQHQAHCSHQDDFGLGVFVLNTCGEVGTPKQDEEAETTEDAADDGHGAGGLQSLIQSLVMFKEIHSLPLLGMYPIPFWLSLLLNMDR